MRRTSSTRKELCQTKCLREKYMADQDFHRELRLKKEDAAEFLRELADNLEDDDPINLTGGEWQLTQPYSGLIPFRVTQDDKGLEIDLKFMTPEE